MKTTTATKTTAAQACSRQSKSRREQEIIQVSRNEAGGKYRLEVKVREESADEIAKWSGLGGEVSAMEEDAMTAGEAGGGSEKWMTMV